MGHGDDTFVQPDTLECVGLVDFGDAYIGHPALDWRWPTHEDHVALLQGYNNETPATDEFMLEL
jgi:hygromycin-B 7''-O-kinase